MAVLKCGHCGAPRDPRSGSCAYCGTVFADPATGKPLGAVDGEIEALIRKRQKIEAIKLYRERHKVGLKEAKDAVDAIEARLR